MKHAYLIMAHNEFEVLSKLVEALDDVRNDIYIHFDAKVQELPIVKTNYSMLYVLSNRINVCWGDLSVVLAEMELFRAAFNRGGYGYYHLLSGVDMPLKSQDYIHKFFEKNNGKEFIGYSTYDTSKEIGRKVKKWHLFPKKFKSKNLFIRGLRAAFLRVQYIFGYERNKNVEFKKGTQWVSITNEMVSVILRQENQLKRVYSHTFCPDEIFLQTACFTSGLYKNVYDINNEGNGCLRSIKWENNIIKEWSCADIKDLVNSKYLFARKFSYNQMDIVDYILKNNMM